MNNDEIIKRLEVNAAWRKRHSEETSIHTQRHKWLVSHIKSQRSLCAYCGIQMEEGKDRSVTDSGAHATLDHVIPLSRGGADERCNTLAVCSKCNSAKGDMDLLAFLESDFLRKRKKKYAKSLPRPKIKVILLNRKRERLEGG